MVGTLASGGGSTATGNETAPLLVVPVLLLTVLVVWWGVRIVRPVQRLERQTTELGQRRFAALETPVGVYANPASANAVGADGPEGEGGPTKFAWLFGGGDDGAGKSGDGWPATCMMRRCNP